MTSATSPATLSETMRRVRLEKLWATKNSHAWRRPLRTAAASARAAACAERSASAAPDTHGVVRSSTWSGPVPRELKACMGRLARMRAPEDRHLIAIGGPRDPAPQSSFLEAISDAVQRLDHLEGVVHRLELLAQALDVTVDGAVIDV